MAVVLDQFTRRERDRLLEANYENAKKARSKNSEVEKHNKSYQELLNYSLSKVPADKRKEAEAQINGKSPLQVDYSKITPELQRMALKGNGEDTIKEVAKNDNINFKIIKDANASKPLSK